MTRCVACLIRAIPIALAVSTSAGAEDALFSADRTPIFIDARDVVSWDAGRSIASDGDVALQQIRAYLRIVRPELPAYEPGTG